MNAIFLYLDSSLLCTSLSPLPFCVIHLETSYASFRIHRYVLSIHHNKYLRLRNSKERCVCQQFAVETLAVENGGYFVEFSSDINSRISELPNNICLSTSSWNTDNSNYNMFFRLGVENKKFSSLVPRNLYTLKVHGDI